MATTVIELNQHLTRIENIQLQVTINTTNHYHNCCGHSHSPGGTQPLVQPADEVVDMNDAPSISGQNKILSVRTRPITAQGTELEQE